VKTATTAAIAMETTRAEPAKPATMPVTTKIPPPMIAPTFMAVALHNPKYGFSALRSSSLLITSLLKNPTKQKHIKSLTELNALSTTHATEACQEILTREKARLVKKI
jgi:hypothetical protein